MYQQSPLSRVAEYLHPQTRIDAAVVARNCTHIVYTTLASAKHMPRLDNANSCGGCPPRTCFVFFTEYPPAPHAVPSGWRVVQHRRSKLTQHMSSRRFSRVPKLMPTVLFSPHVTTLFKDTKILLERKAPKRLFGLLRNLSVQFVAFQHPMLCYDKVANALGACNATAWTLAEAQMIATRQGGCENTTALFEQVRSYLPTIRPEDPYIDGAILVQQGATSLFDAWATEYFRAGASDRDQPAFAHVAPRAATTAWYVPYNRTQCKALGVCHWYLDGKTGRLNRINFDEKPLWSERRKRSMTSDSNARASTTAHGAIRREGMVTAQLSRKHSLQAKRLDHGTYAPVSARQRGHGLIHNRTARLVGSATRIRSNRVHAAAQSSLQAQVTDLKQQLQAANSDAREAWGKGYAEGMTAGKAQAH